jgi:hypothetical protein
MIKLKYNSRDILVVSNDIDYTDYNLIVDTLPNDFYQYWQFRKYVITDNQLVICDGWQDSNIPDDYFENPQNYDIVNNLPVIKVPNWPNDTVKYQIFVADANFTSYVLKTKTDPILKIFLDAALNFNDQLKTDKGVYFWTATLSNTELNTTDAQTLQMLDYYGIEYVIR